MAPESDRGVDRLFAGGGRMGAVMASWDWAVTPVGRPQGWPAALRQVVRILLTSRFSMWLAWGPELTVFYNDAYLRDTLWAEIWNDIGPRIRSVLDSGEATWDESLLLFLERAGYVEETYHTFSYSPLHDGDGRVAGMLCVVSEDTERVLGERRLRILSELGDITAVTAPTIAQACTASLAVLQRGRRDIPFASIYLLEQHGQYRAGVREDVREVDGVEIGPLGIRLLVEGLACTAVVADVVHEHVDPPVLVPCRGDQRVRGIRIADVAHDPDRTFADRDLRLSRALAVDLGEDDLGTFGNEPFDDAPADAGTAARHDRDLPGEQRLHAR